MRSTSRDKTIIVHHSTTIELGLLVAGIAVGWFLAVASGVGKLRSQASTPNLEQIPPKPTQAKPNEVVQRLFEWKNGAPWTTSLNLTAFNEVSVGATLQDLRDLQTQTQVSAQNAHADAFAKYNETQDVRYSKQADVINQKDDEFNEALKLKALSLVGGDISSLKEKSDDLKKAGEEIPGSANTIGQIDKYIGVFDQLIALV